MKLIASSSKGRLPSTVLRLFSVRFIGTPPPPLSFLIPLQIVTRQQIHFTTALSIHSSTSTLLSQKSHFEILLAQNGTEKKLRRQNRLLGQFSNEEALHFLLAEITTTFNSTTESRSTARFMEKQAFT